MKENLNFKWRFGEEKELENNSLLYSGIEGIIAELSNEDKTNIIEFRISGESEIEFNGEYYNDWQDFPDELVKLIETGKIYDWSDSNNKAEIISNNWFEMIAIKKDENSDWYDEISSVVLEDEENLNINTIEEMMTEFYNEVFDEE